MSVGQSISMVDSQQRVTGGIDYTLNFELPRMLHACVLHSPHAHARIVKVDASKAEKLPGVAAVLTREVTVADVNAAFEQAAATKLPGVLRYSTEAIVSRDIIGDPASCVFDSPLTQAAGTLVKVFGWYDNEWGYACRLVDLAEIVGARL